MVLILLSLGKYETLHPQVLHILIQNPRIGKFGSQFLFSKDIYHKENSFWWNKISEFYFIIPYNYLHNNNTFHFSLKTMLSLKHLLYKFMKCGSSTYFIILALFFLLFSHYGCIYASYAKISNIRKQEMTEKITICIFWITNYSRTRQTTVTPAATEAQATANPTGMDLELPVDPNEPTYCFCNQVSYGAMVACDNPNVCVFVYLFFPIYFISILPTFLTYFLDLFKMTV